MNQKRKAEIQRKLTLARVPAPPDGLSERIKADIPKYLLDPQKDRERLSRSIAANLRVAAAILLLVSSAFVFVNILSKGESEPAMMSAAKESVAPKAASADAALPPATGADVGYPAAPTANVPVAEVQLQLAEVRQEAAQPASRRDQREREARTLVADASVSADVPAFMPAPVASPEPKLAKDEVRQEIANAEGTIGGTAASQSQKVFAYYEAPPATPSRESIAVNAAAPSVMARATAASIVPSAQAAELDLGPQSSVFGISVEREAFHRVKNVIESGERPTAQNVNVEALVNYFAGAPKRAPREVRLEVEGSPLPVPSGARKAIVRFTVDTANADVRNGGSTPPVASDAHLHIDFASDAVVSFRRIGDDSENGASEAMLLSNTSVTALYEVELSKTVTPRQRIATVRLRYKSVATGKPRTVEQTLRGSNFAGTWMAATPRHRLASLGAVWGESLKNAATSDTSRKADVAKKAEELAMKEPKDDRARELAEVASASSRL